MTTYEEFGGIYQIDKNIKYIINVFENSTEENIFMNKEKRSTTIINACSGTKNHFAYGYLWYYGKDLHLIKDKLIDFTWF
jgi:hypothetical protein